MKKSDDPRLQAFRQLKSSPHDHPASPTFLAEGQILIETLAQGGWTFETILLGEHHAARLADLQSRLPSREWVIADSRLIDDSVGFSFHGGMLAIGQRPTPKTLAHYLGTAPKNSGWLLCDQLGKQDNVALLCRSAKAFGYQGVICTEDAGNLHSRKALRQSMGASLLLPVIQCKNLHQPIEMLKSDGFALYGAHLSKAAHPFRLEPLPQKVGLILGHETNGLSRDVRNLCDREIFIPMTNGHDSLNVAAAGAILLEHFSQRFPNRFA